MLHLSLHTLEARALDLFVCYVMRAYNACPDNRPASLSLYPDNECLGARDNAIFRTKRSVDQPSFFGEANSNMLSHLSGEIEGAWTIGE